MLKIGEGGSAGAETSTSVAGPMNDDEVRWGNGSGSTTAGWGIGLRGWSRDRLIGRPPPQQRVLDGGARR
jgi:hypothetical protein